MVSFVAMFEKDSFTIGGPPDVPLSRHWNDIGAREHKQSHLLLRSR